jgi:hypothetical protein
MYANIELNRKIGRVGKTKNPSTRQREMRSIDTMSFVPTPKQRTQLIEQSKLAAKSGRGSLVSKLHFLPAKIGLCPASLDPRDTILSKVGANAKIRDPNVGLSAVADQSMPIANGSCGPNIVLYNKNRINLFHNSEKQTKTLLQQVLKFRRDNSTAIFDLYCTSLRNHLEGAPIKSPAYALKVGKDEVLDSKFHTMYSDICELFGTLNTVIKNQKLTLEEAGVGVNSFCQTWLRKKSPQEIHSNGAPAPPPDGKVGDAQFSVMSPHFQTRHYLQDERAVLRTLEQGGVDSQRGKQLLRSYLKLLNKFDEDMCNPYGIGGGGQAFVNIDKLGSKML